MKKFKLYFYDRTELVLITLLFLFGALFAFTAGVHWGKQVGFGTAPVGTGTESVGKIEGTEESLPSREELDSKVEGAEYASGESLTRSLQEEVARTGIRLDVPRQVELPKQARSERAEKTSPESPESVDAVAHAPESKASAVTRTETETAAPLTVAKRDETAYAKTVDTSVKPTYVLQVGSYPTEEEARKKSKLLEMAGHTPTLHKLEVEGKGTRYRVLLGSFESQAQAESFAKEQVSKHTLDSYLVIKKPQ